MAKMHPKGKTFTSRTGKMLSGATNLVTKFSYCSNTLVKEGNVQTELDTHLI